MMDYEARVLDHYEHPYHRHMPTKASEYFAFYVTGSRTNTTCGDHVRYWGRLNAGHERRIAGLWWDGSGCCFSQAMASMLAEHCEAKRLYEVKAFTQDDMFNLFGLDVEQGRVECVLVAYRALMRALENHDE